MIIGKITDLLWNSYMMKDIEMWKFYKMTRRKKNGKRL